MQENASVVFDISKTTRILNEGYVLIFQHPLSNQLIFLANCADIKSICYSKNPKLPGTQNIKKAMIYKFLEDARRDIYLLRYYHRQFLQINIFAKRIFYLSTEHIIKENDSELTYYSKNDLQLKDTLDSFEN